ncbi:tetracycline resistance protein [Sphingobacterium siyangense]|uniref:Flavin-dependent monooxygenase n=1 Tax=Sphingobacterium siyangense TaxID=459529 RepID=A0A420FVI4_9SPHI|nr:NAD(P)/FAD-dependent oxidoreductase [Sphingobacterium siyangense]RKF36843.1 tetracycline resistance protein [Sphingobacterium siyangense]
MLLQDKKVIVIGAGPVGLTFARLIQEKGANVKVYDRDIDQFARIKGGTLDLHYDTGQRAMLEAGLLSEFYDRSRPTGEKAVDIHGHIIYEKFPDKVSRYYRPEIDRNDLRMLLIENLMPDTVIWDSKLVSLEKHDEKYLLHFENGTTETADLVVGANGGMSNVRKYITDTTPQYTGSIIIQGEVLNPEKNCPNFKKLCGNDNLGVVAEQKFFFSQVKAKGVLNYYVSFRRPESWIKEHELDFQNNTEITTFLKGLLSNWSDVYKELFQATDEFTLLPMRKLPLENWNSHHNITLIGDAAHVMPPYSGIGVNIGLLDALYLAQNLTDERFADIDTAIASYEEKMFEYASLAQKQTSESEERIHSDKDFEEIDKGKR